MHPLSRPLPLSAHVTSKNRVFLAPLTNMQSHEGGTLSDDELRFLTARAEGGFGVVETCAAYVSPEGKAWPGELGVHDDAMLPGLRRLAAALRASGAVGCVQLFHGGLRATPSVSGLPTLSASAFEEEGLLRRRRPWPRDSAVRRWSHQKGLTVPRAATEADIERIIGDFAAAARRAALAGFEAVELHGAHGYLLSQFASSVYNRRDDRWGGSAENRGRLMIEVLRAVRAAVPELAVFVRLSPEDYGQAKGIDLDEAIALAAALAREGMDVLHLSLWRSAQPTHKRPDSHATPLFREAVGADVKIVVAGQIWTRADAEAQLALGADAIALGRAAIAHPDWLTLALEGAGEPPRPPFTAEALAAAALSPTFIEYMRRWKGFVAG